MRKVKKKNMFEKLQEKIKDTIDEKKTKTSSRTRTTAKRKDSTLLLFKYLKNYYLYIEINLYHKIVAFYYLNQIFINHINTLLLL